MARDVMYYFDKKAPYERHELGEIQSDFNMGLTIDGAKDSLQVQIYGFESKPVSPNTILFHSATNTWWVAKRDIVKRNANESTYYYTHKITIVGAIDLLGSRDLTDCGFNDKAYNIEYFIRRLFSLSNFEFFGADFVIDFGNNLNKNQMVNYIKSFENYTLLSALREFLNGYNCDSKLTFTTQTISDKVYIKSATLVIIPRTGNVDLPIVDISVFDDVRETKTMNKESYGTTVISNAQNVNSTLAKTYPQIGGIALTGDQYNTAAKDLFMRLPTPIYNVNWVRAMSKVRFRLYGGTGTGALNINGELFYPQSRVAFDNAYEKFSQQCIDNGAVFGPHTEEEIEYMYKVALGASQITFYNNGFDYNIHTHKITKKTETPYLALMQYGSLISEMRTMVLTDKQTRDGMYEGYYHALYWERGGNKIDGFEIFFNTGSLDHATQTKYASRTDLKLFGIDSVRIAQTDPRYIFSIGYGAVPATTSYEVINEITTQNTMWQINYIPMSDVKIKYDNSRNDLDIQLYNQNGKLNDSVSLSKLVDSYSKEIQSDNITRYMHYTNFNDIPKVGQLVNNNGEIYVINNISYDFYVNETNNDDNVGYYIECEFTLSKYISVKSLMVNPNSNIRDYAIPQKYNVKRRQTYRDYYEFSLTQDSDANQNDPYVPLDKYLLIDREPININYDHTAIMELSYDDLVDGNKNWYYQLSSTAYVMNKSVYEIIDFNDNNIIGYDMQNAGTGFNMSKLFDGTLNRITTPISYVDDKGKVKGFSIQMVNNENLNTLYENILSNYGNYDTQTLSSHVFVGKDFYYGKYEETSTSKSISITRLALETQRYAVDIDGTPVTTLIFQFNLDNYNVESTIDFDTISFTNVKMKYPSSTGSYLSNVEVYDYSINGRYITLTIVSTDTQHFSSAFASAWVDLEFVFNYSYTGQKLFDGAVDIKDYEIIDLNYNKDAIEVPVFQYNLQLGDTEQVEVGSNILRNQNNIYSLYRCSIQNAHKVNQLNATKFFSTMWTDGNELIGNTDFLYSYVVNSTHGVVMSFENNNQTLRIKFYGTQSATFYGNESQEYFEYQSYTNGSQISKSNLIGKDIVIYKSMIKSMNYDSNQNTSTCDYDNELMFIIHNPQDSNFDGDDLLINVNYYKLK